MPKNLPLHKSVDALLPLEPQDYHILLLLLDGECHGYRMVKEMSARPKVDSGSRRAVYTAPFGA